MPRPLPLILQETLIAAGVPVERLSMGDYADKATWLVYPPALQSAAQPIIEAFDADSQAVLVAESDLVTDMLLNTVADDLVTALLENFGAFMTEADAGTLPGNLATWKHRLRRRVKALRRARS